MGGGVCGLAAGLLLRRDGHEVAVLERDPAPVPDSVEEAWEGRSRESVTQFRLPHFMLSRGRLVLKQVVARSAEAEPGLEIRRGVAVRELVVVRTTARPR
jgi:glycine/D-amino acid oxidase-like deaminating enzyme